MVRRHALVGKLLEFTRFKLVAAVTLSTVMGYALFGMGIGWPVLWPTFGVLLLGCGCSALNQIQEVHTDGQMARTRNRPMPQGQFSTGAAWLISVGLIFAGWYCLASIDRHSGVILALGVFTPLWYNGVYTYLKKVTYLAVFPGAVLGAIPPVSGWCAAGGVIWDLKIMFVALYFFVWQVPHFWLLMLLRGKEYEQAGLKSITGKFAEPQLGRIIFAWLMATGCLGFLTGLYINIDSIWLLGILLCSVWFVLKSLFLLNISSYRNRWREAFLNCIIYNILFMAFMVLGGTLK